MVIERRSGGGVGVFLLGLAVGTGLALLFAPQAGEDTRAAMARNTRKMRRKARRFMESTSDAAHHAAGTARHAATETREAIERRLSRHGSPDADASAYDGEDDGV